MGVLQVELHISKEMAIWDDSFKYVGEVGIGVERRNKIFKGDFIWNLIDDFISTWSICIASTLPKTTFTFNTQKYQQYQSNMIIVIKCFATPIVQLLR